MPNWKKVIVSGSDALLNSVSGSSFVYSGGDVIAAQNLRSIYSSGDEGGEIFLNKPATNTSITTGVNIDIYQNKLRIWETGGTNRGFYLDMTTGGTGVGTNLASGGGTVTSVSASGTVSGITLGGGPITGAGTLTLSGTISGLTNSNLSGTAGITNANLANSAITIAGTSTSLGGSITAATILSGTGVHSGSNSVTIGSTAISLGGTSTTLAGLSSVTSTSFVGALTGNASTATQTTATVTGTNSADLVYGNMADNDQFRIRVGGTATNAGFVEIATADDGTEPIHVRQYTGVFTSLARTATLLDGSGNTTFPGTVTANGTLLTGNTGTVTSVGGTGTVNGITLTGTVNSSGNLTLGGTLSGIGNAQLTNSAITIAGTSTALGSSISQATILASSGVFSGSAQIPNSSIANAQLANSSITVGSTAISLGSSATTIAGLSSVTSTTFVGALTGNASTATSAATWTTGRTITIGSTGKTVDGSGNVSWTLGEIGAQAVLTNPVTGSGTVSYIPKFTQASAIGNSVMYDSGTSIGIGNTSPSTYLNGTTGLSIYNASLPGLGLANSSATWVHYLTGTEYRLYNSSTGTAMTLLTNGNVGIGKPSPIAKLDVSGSVHITGSAQITGSLLVRDGFNTILDTANFLLKDNSGTNVVDWGNRELRDTNNTVTVDWEQMYLSSPQGGGVTTVKWGAGLLNDTSTSQSIDWDQRLLHDINGTPAVAYQARALADTNESKSIHWENRQIHDANAIVAIDYGARRLYNGAGIGLLNWGGTYATLEGTASWATNVVNNGVTSVGGTGTVNGISLSGTVTSTGNLTLGGTLSGIGNAQLTNSSITIGSTAISLGASSTTLTGLTSVTSTNFIGTASKADTILITEELSTDATCYPTFTRNTPGYQNLFTDSTGLVYKPSTNTLTATTFEGTLNGNASTAATATNANNIAVTNTTTGTGPYYLMFADGTSGNRTARVDSTTLTYNATTDTLTVANLAGTAASSSTILANNFAAGTYSIPWMSQTAAGVATRLNGGTSLTYVTSTGQLNNTGSIMIQQTANTFGNGVRLRQQGTTNYWDIFNTGSTGTYQNTLNFKYNGGVNGGYLIPSTDAAGIDFTGQHRSLSNTINITGSADLTGLIVVADGTYTNLNNNHLPQINEALPNVSLSTVINDKRVFGVISDKEDDNGERTYAMGNWASTYKKSNANDIRLIINSLGEGGMWVCNANGSLENGDYITTSNLPGYGMKQADDVLHNYTVAKITEDCLFDSIRVIDFEYSGSVYKKQFVGVTYHCG